MRLSEVRCCAMQRGVVWGDIIWNGMVWYDRLLMLCSFYIYRWFYGRLKLIEGLKQITGCKYLYFITVSRN